MKFDILTLFPEMINGFLSESILGRAVNKGIIDINCTNIRRFANDKHNRVDDYPFGGGLGMVMRPQPVFDAYNYVTKDSKSKPYTIYMSPKGKVFNQEIAKQMALKEHVVIICGHYEGIDQRVIDEICDEEISIGDYVLTGGEIAACVVCDSVARLVPGVLAENSSFELESHYNGLLEQPQYTRPRVFNGKSVPEVLLSGNTQNILKWEHEKSVELTMKVRPDLCEKQGIKVEESSTPNLSENVLVLGVGEDCDRKIQTVKMHCTKNGLNKIDFKCVTDDKIDASSYDGVFLIVCGDYKNFELKTDALKLSCGYLSDTQKNTEIFSFLPKEDFEITENVFMSSSEIACEIYDFCIACAFKNKGFEDAQSLIEHITGEKSIKFVFKNGVPYDLYENNREKFKNYEQNDLLFIETENTIENGAITIVSQNDARMFLAQGDIYKVKSKKYGKAYVFTAKGLGTFYRFCVTENGVNEFCATSGCSAKTIFKVVKATQNKEIVCCGEVKQINPFS